MIGELLAYTKNNKIMLVVSCIVTFYVLNVGAVSKLVVRTTNGFVRGKLNYYGNFTYYSFLSIPYAENPTGVLRFQPPVPKKPWSHVLDATKDGVVCPQWNMRYKFEQMSEDCLRLNIYVPEHKKQELPVLFFIHGGGFVLLSGNSDYLYGPQFFLQREMIVVTLNYRLGPLGFLSLDINEASGNAGIKDIILALKWINTNILKFGGNKNKITIGGHSSGAAIVHYLLLTKQADRLFQQAILISGSVLNHRFLSQHPKDDALSLAEYLGIKSDDPHIILRKLQEIDVFEIVEAFKQLSSTFTNVLRPCNLFVPCVEKKFSHAVITEHPMKILKTVGLIQNVPILTGINAQEGLYMIQTILNDSEGMIELSNNNELCIPTNIEFPRGSREARQLGNLISDMYFHSDKSGSFDMSTETLLELATDIRYCYSVYAWTKLHKSNPKSNKLYFYKFDFNGDLNWAKLNYRIQDSGTSHADELGYIFVTNRTANRIENADKDSKQMINVIVDLFSNFINFGTPQHSSDIKWPEFDMKEQKYILIGRNPTVESLLNSSASKQIFWDDVYHHYFNYVKNGGKRENKCAVN